MNFSEGTEGWTSRDLTFNSEHILNGIVTEIKHGKTPYTNLILPDKNGDALIAIYEKDQGIIGWSRIETQGDIISTAMLHELGSEVTWMIVRRNGILYLERESIDDITYMDFSRIESQIVAANQFFGFDHLIGMTVQVIADDILQADQIVAPDGSITLDSILANKVMAGLSFNALIETLPQQSDSQEGNTLKFAKRYNEIWVAILDSARPIINGMDSALRSPSTPMNSTEPFKTEIIEVKNLGWDVESSIIVEQPLPLPLNISAVGGKIKESKV